MAACCCDGVLLCSQIDQQLRRLGFEPHIAQVGAADSAAPTADDGADGEAPSDEKGAPKPFEYLLSMPIASLTKERVTALRKQLKEATAERKRLEKTSVAQVPSSSVHE